MQKGLDGWFQHAEANGYGPHLVESGDGRLLVVERGARLLAASLPGVEGDLFFNNDACTGGDRLWIAPEVAYYWPSLEQAREDPVKWAATPPAVDPGDYALGDAWPGGVHLHASMSLRDARDDKRINLDVTRVFAAIDPPDGLPAGLKCLSFAVTNELTVNGGDDGAVAGAWDILQIPPVGTLICPTTTGVDPRSYYDPFGERHVQCDSRAVRFFIDADRRIKMGLRPEHTTGRMGYYRMVGEVATLIVRIFGVYPGEPYIDIPRDHPADQRRGGDVLQAYNDDLTFGAFGEMEYHDPAVRVGGCERRYGQSVTHILAGDDAVVCSVGAELLGAPVEPIV